jgi:hypothetical protein
MVGDVKCRHDSITAEVRVVEEFEGSPARLKVQKEFLPLAAIVEQTLKKRKSPHHHGSTLPGTKEESRALS